MTVPDRFRAKAERLGEIATRNDGSDLGDVALELASFIVESTHTEHAGTAPAPLGERIDRLAAEVDARFVTHELAFAELARRLAPAPGPEPEATVFGVPVVLAAGITPERIRKEIAELPAGLDDAAAVAALEERGLLTRTPTKGQ